MSTSLEKELTIKTVQTKLADPAKLAAEGLPANDVITLTNDINIGVLACVSNGLLGTRSIGYVLPGNSVKLPSGAAWWDVYLLRETGGAIICDLFVGNIFYDAMKSNVNSTATLKVSQFY
jgi:hypothetical protein